MRHDGLTAVVLAAVLMLGLAAARPSAAQEARDPIEPFNRAVFEVNRGLDTMFLKPVAQGYRLVTPQFARDGINNFLLNLRTPVVFANDLMQAEFDRAALTLGRFMLNTIMGLGGLIDIGAHVGMPERHSEDFGQTLAVWGAGEGPFLMLPLFGPSNPRDAVGKVVDFLFDPLTFIAPTEVNLARTGADIVTFREANIETIDELERGSVDFYVATRTVYRQFRDNEIRNGAPAALDDIYDEDIFDELDEDFDDPDAQ